MTGIPIETEIHLLFFNKNIRNFVYSHIVWWYMYELQFRAGVSEICFGRIKPIYSDVWERKSLFSGFGWSSILIFHLIVGWLYCNNIQLYKHKTLAHEKKNVPSIFSQVALLRILLFCSHHIMFFRACPSSFKDVCVTKIGRNNIFEAKVPISA